MDLSTNERQLGWSQDGRGCPPGPVPLALFTAGGILSFMFWVNSVVGLHRCKAKHHGKKNKCSESGVVFWLVVFGIMVFLFIRQVKKNLARKRTSSAQMESGFYDEDEGEVRV